jgi:hypothetical protein
MFPKDFIMAHTGLSSHVIDRFEKSCGFDIPKIKGAKYYNLTHLITFRLISFLKAEGIKVKNIEYAAQYLQRLNPETSLSSLCLYHDGRNIIDLQGNPPRVLNQEGQTVLKDVKEPFCVAVGGILSEAKRKASQAITELQAQRDTPIQDCTPVSVEALLNRLRA